MLEANIKIFENYTKTTEKNPKLSMVKTVATDFDKILFMRMPVLENLSSDIFIRHTHQ